MITPIEIQSKTFKSGGLGYDKKDVDGFMREVLRSYEQIYRENMELNDKVGVLTEGIQYYKTIEKTLQKALVLAEKTAQDTKAAALEKAKAIEKEAKTRSQFIVADAKNELEHIHTQTIQLIQQYERYKCQFKNLAKAQMELIESECFNINLARLDALIDTNPEVQETRKQQEKNKRVQEPVKDQAIGRKQVQDKSMGRKQVQDQSMERKQVQDQSMGRKQVQDQSIARNQGQNQTMVRNLGQEQSKPLKKHDRVLEDNIPETYFDALAQISATEESDHSYTSTYTESEDSKEYSYNQQIADEDYSYDEEEDEENPYDQKDELDSQDEFSFINLVDEED